MDSYSQESLELHAKRLEEWVKNGSGTRGGPTPAPSVGLLNSIGVAALILVKYTRNKEYLRAAAVLNYHVKQPAAWMFRDPVTMRAMKNGIEALRMEAKRG